MCPVCMTTTLTLIAGSVSATGGLTALAARIFRNKTGAGNLFPKTESEGERR
jgi:hypothetical protein